MKQTARRLLPFYLLPFVGVAVALFLFYLKNEYRQRTEEQILSTVRSFPVGYLGEGRVLPDIEGVIRWTEQVERSFPEIERLVVIWRRNDGREFPLYPLSDVPAPEEYDRPVMPLLWRGETRGSIGIVLNQWRYNLPEYIAWGVVALLLLAIPSVVAHVVGQERRILGVEALLDQKTQELVRLEKLGLVGMLTANIFHDIKKPMLNIRAELEALEGGEVKEAIQEQSDLFLRMIRELGLEGFLRGSESREEFLDIEEIVDRSLRLVRYEMDHVTIVKENLEGLPLVLGVGHRLVQVFSNLFLNACQAMEQSGTLTIRGGVVEGDPQRLTVTVSDTGRGIPEKEIGRIFEPFYSTGGEESTGLGLYITHSILHDMGGALEARSREGEGATFTVTLPVRD